MSLMDFFSGTQQGSRRVTQIFSSPYTFWGVICIVFFLGLYNVHSAFDATSWRHWDSKVFIAAGHSWAAGYSPYQNAQLDMQYQLLFEKPRPEHQVFAYPPNMAMLALPLAMLAVDTAYRVMDFLNFVLFFGLIWCSAVWAGKYQRSLLTRRWMLLGCCAVAALSYPAWNVVRNGQVSIFAVFFITALWLIKSRKYIPALSVVVIAFCTIKPTCTLLFLIYTLIILPRTVILASIPVLLVVLGVAQHSNGAGIITDWLAASSQYTIYGANLPDNLCSGINLLARIGIPSGVPIFLGILSSICFACWIKRRHRDPWSPPNFIVLTSLTLFFLPAHGLDLVMVIPFLAAISTIHWRFFVYFGVGALPLVRPNLLPDYALFSSLSIAYIFIVSALFIKSKPQTRLVQITAK